MEINYALRSHQVECSEDMAQHALVEATPAKMPVKGDSETDREGINMKYVTIISPGEMDDPTISLVLVRPGLTTADILHELKLWGYVLFLLSYPARFFDWKEELYERISNGACLYALEPSVADDLWGLSLCTYPEEFAHLFVREVRERRGLLADSQTNSTFNLNQLYQPRGTNHDCKTS